MRTSAFGFELEGILRMPKGILTMEDGPKTVKAWFPMALVTILATIE